MSDSTVVEGQQTWRKRPAESFFAAMDFTNRLETGEVITGATCQGTDAGVTLGAPIVSTPLVKFRVSGGTPATQGVITIIINAHNSGDGADNTNDEIYEAVGRIVIDPIPPG
jgi:hypothetical protein